jgi:hypothetical protein
LVKARARLKILPILNDELAYSDVVREAQEIVELALKGMLRHIGVEPPHWHDVGGLVAEHRIRFPTLADDELSRVVSASTWLRKEREFAFYGDIDLIPTEQYSAVDAARARAEAEAVVALAVRVMQPPVPEPPPM